MSSLTHRRPLSLPPFATGITNMRGGRNGSRRTNTYWRRPEEKTDKRGRWNGETTSYREGKDMDAFRKVSAHMYSSRVIPSCSNCRSPVIMLSSLSAQASSRVVTGTSTRVMTSRSSCSCRAVPACITGVGAGLPTCTCNIKFVIYLFGTSSYSTALKEELNLKGSSSI